MDAPEGRARVPARITIQVSDDLRSKLNQLAKEEHGGNLQALIRETLQERVDGRVSETELIHQVLTEVQEIGRGITRRHEDLQGRILRLLEYARQLAESAGVQHMDIAALSEIWLELKGGLDNHGELIGRLAARVECQNDALTGLTGHIERQSEAIEQIVELAGNEPRGKRRSFLGL